MSLPKGAPAQDVRLTQEYLARIVRRARKTFHVPAVAVTAMNSETIMAQEIQGERALGQGTPATLDDYFHIGSCSKSVLAVMAARLTDQKKMTWLTKFFEVFPELQGDADDAYRDITLEDLFLGEAGIKAYTDAQADPFPEVDSGSGDKRREFIKFLLRQPPSSEKKDGRFQHLYSNAGYMMASAMLERISGLGYEDLARKTLAGDLGLSVHIGWPNSLGPDQPWGHMVSKGKVEAFPPGHDYVIPYLITPAGDLCMTPRDFARYTQMHLRGLTGHESYISSESYRRIHFGHKGYSLGVANGVWGGRRYSGFDGSAGTFFCRSLIVPDSEFAFSIMTNAGSGSGAMKAVDWLTVRIVKKRFRWWWKLWL